MRDWQPVLQRFQALSTLEKMFWLSRLIFELSIFARGTYEAGKEGVANPVALRRVNELVHRIAGFQKALAFENGGCMPDQALFALLEHELPVLEGEIGFLFAHLP